MSAFFDFKAVRVLAFAYLLLAMAGCDGLTGQEEAYIQMRGVSNIEVEPDIGYIEASVNVTGDTEEAVYADLAAKSERVLNALQQIGIPRDKIYGSDLEFDVSVADSYESPRIGGYAGAWTVKLEFTPAGASANIVETLLNNGANDILGIAYGLKDWSEHEAKARKSALEDSRSRASDVAYASGSHLGRLIAASDEERFTSSDKLELLSQSTLAEITVEAQKNPGVTLKPEPITVSSEVYARWAIAPLDTK